MYFALRLRFCLLPARLISKDRTNNFLFSSAVYHMVPFQSPFYSHEICLQQDLFIFILVILNICSSMKPSNPVICLTLPSISNCDLSGRFLQLRTTEKLKQLGTRRHAFISSPIDYCNSLCGESVSQSDMSRLQLVQQGFSRETILPLYWPHFTGLQLNKELILTLFYLFLKHCMNRHQCTVYLQRPD